MIGGLLAGVVGWTAGQEGRVRGLMNVGSDETSTTRSQVAACIPVLSSHICL